MNDVTATIISFNHRNLLARCLTSVTESIQAAGIRADIIVLDNASADGSPDMVLAEFPAVKLIVQPEPQGFVLNQNLLFQAALKRSRYVLALNDDTILERDTLSALLEAADADRAIAAIGPQLLFPDGSFQTAGERLPSWSYHLLRHLKIGSLVPSVLRRNLGSWDASQSGSNMVRDVGYISGACMLVRTDALASIGFFDDRFVMYSEDADWCHSAHEQGWRICVAMSVRAVHHKNQSWGAFSARERERSMYRYLKKRSVGRVRMALLKTVVIAGCACRIMTAQVRGMLPRRQATDPARTVSASRDIIKLSLAE